VPTLQDLAREVCGLDHEALEWLSQLVGDWQLLSDLSFADLVLWGGDGRGDFVVLAHCRPSTAATVHPRDRVGTRAEGPEHDVVGAALAQGTLVHGDAVDAVPVRVRGRAVAAVLTRHAGSVRGRDGSGLEQEYLEAADQLMRMVGEGSYPQDGAPTAARRGAPRVGDGLIRLDADGVVTYASPNALSNYHRLGLVDDLEGASLAELTTGLVDGPDPVDESLAVVVTGRAPWRTQVQSARVELSLRAVPLLAGGERVGALVLCRDVSELQRRERELLTKDATIREIHHRVKNNLQTVSALLRLQARRIDLPEARAALEEAMRRVATIALVHETLSHGFDESVDFDGLLDRGLALTTSVLAPDGARSRRVGTFGVVHAEDANALALVLVELVSNAVEHGRRDGEAVPADVLVTVERDGDHLCVTVSDDGPGLPPGFVPGAGGLGTQIVQSLVAGELRGTIEWRSPVEGGTEAVVRVRLRDPAAR
jgi:two-component sensor histidine kinase